MHLYGLAQYQDGIWDWRGLPLEMRQLNTRIAVPVLASSAGYGLLWNNASRANFNPRAASDEIPLTRVEGGAVSGPTATEQHRAAPDPHAVATRQGIFTSAAAGRYAFCTGKGDRRNEIPVLVDGVPVAGVINTWTSRAVLGTIELPPHKPVSETAPEATPECRANEHLAAFSSPLAIEPASKTLLI